MRLDAGDAAPDLGELAGLVVMGGPMGVGDEADHPWLAAERALVRDAVGRGLPVLGVCLGAQQLAAALGAEVKPGPAPEIGPGRVVLTAAGRRDRVFGPEYGGLADTGEVSCVHWHADTFALPGGAVHLAATAAYPHRPSGWVIWPTACSSTSRWTLRWPRAGDLLSRLGSGCRRPRR